MRITEQLIRQRTEHHDGILDELEEIALHQLEIERIENLDKCCRHLKILLLQNNLIEKIENVRKMKEMEYLNLALNNICKVENLEGCESLKKLDLTVNFVDLNTLEESLCNLQANENLKDLYLMGNPCTEWPDFRLFVVALLPQLSQLDGKIVTPTERIEALRELPRLHSELARKIKEQRLKPPVTSEASYTIENRKKMYLELAKERSEREGKNEQAKKQPKKPPSVYNENGDIRQCNQGRYEFVLDQTSEPDKIILEIRTPKYLCSTAIDVDLHPTYVRCLIKNKLTQLRLPAEISVEASQVKHSKVTGHLRFEMPLLDPPFKKEKRLSLADRKRLRELSMDASVPAEHPLVQKHEKCGDAAQKHCFGERGNTSNSPKNTNFLEGGPQNAPPPPMWSTALEAHDDYEDLPNLETVV